VYVLKCTSLFVLAFLQPYKDKIRRRQFKELKQQDININLNAVFIAQFSNGKVTASLSKSTPVHATFKYLIGNWILMTSIKTELHKSQEEHVLTASKIWLLSRPFACQ